MIVKGFYFQLMPPILVFCLCSVAFENNSFYSQYYLTINEQRYSSAFFVLPIRYANNIACV